MPPAVQILLVEDDEAHAELVSRSFEGTPATRLKVVNDIESARAELIGDAPKPDIIITDLRLPDGRGTELLSGARDLQAPPIIVMTSQGDETAAVEAMKAGALDYIVKSETTFADMPHITERALREWRHIRENARLEAALLEGKRLAGVGQTAAMLAHEIRNPLNAMSLNAELLKRRLRRREVSDPKIDTSLASIVSEIQRLDALLGEFRSLSAQQTLDVRQASFAELLSAVLNSQKPLLDGAGVEVVEMLNEQLPTFPFDQSKITQVLVNLFKNAVEAMPEGGTLLIEAMVSEHSVTLAVSDTGGGIPNGIDVFEPFKTTKAEGTGLGLPVAKRIVVAHGGSLSCENGEQGARFTIVLPLVPPEPAVSK